MIIRFGKHYGEQLKDVPRDYLEWLIREDVQPKYHKAIKKILAVPEKEEDLTEFMLRSFEKAVVEETKPEGWSEFKARRKEERALEARTAHKEFIKLISVRLGHAVVD